MAEYVFGIVILVIFVSVIRLLFVPGRLSGMEDRINDRTLFAADELANRIENIAREVKELRGEIDRLQKDVQRLRT